MRVNVRERRDSDLREAAAALVEVHNSDGYPVEGVVDPAAWLLTASTLNAWVAELGGKIVGHVSIGIPGSDDAAARLWSELPEGQESEVGVLGRLFVLASARGLSAGERLIQAATMYADAVGLRLVLDVMAKDASAIRLYERLGWTRIGEASHGTGHGDVVAALCYVAPPPVIDRAP